MLLPTTKDSTQLVKASKSHDEINTYSHLIRHLSTDKDARKLTILLIINLVCAVLEVIYGLLSNSIGLLSDSAHMLFDSTALAVGIYASYKATLPANSKFSYGFDRFQTLSGLINGIFLIFIGFYIFIESLERIYNPPVIHCSKMIVVAIIGLIVNVVGVTFFHEHAHFGDDHGCSHGHGHSHSHKEEKKQVKSHQHNHSHAHHDHSDNIERIESSASIDSTVSSIKEDEIHAHHHHAGCNHGHNSQQPDHHHQHHCSHEKKDHHDHSHSHSHHSHAHAHEHKHELVHAHAHEECDHDHDHDHHHDHSHDDHGHHHHNENLYGVFLHILADLLGSVGVITSSILIMLFDWYIADAICSAITSLLILASVVPLIKSSIMVFLQTYPERYKKNFHQALSDISQHPAVVEFRDPHLWMYTQSKLVCSVILVVKQNTTDTNSVIEFARKKLKTIKSIEYMTIDCRVEGQN